MRVLLVDDDPTVLFVAAAVLKREGFEVVQAQNGAEALEKLNSGTFELLITDVQMPEMNGWVLVRKVRSQPKTALLPVVFMTALTSQQDRIKGFGLGADDYVAKPVHPAELVLRAQEAVRRAALMHENARKAMLAPVQMEGSLDQFGLPTLLMLMSMEKKTGRLVIVSEEGNLQVLLQAGRPLYAALSGDAPATGKEALFEALTWDEGRFTFKVCEVLDQDEINSNVQDILLEAANILEKQEVA